MTIDSYIPGASTASAVAPDAGAAYSPSALERIPSTMPMFISRDQAYYWSFLWQSDIHEAMVALEAGDYEEFNSDDPSDVVRWLLGEED